MFDRLTRIPPVILLLSAASFSQVNLPADIADAGARVEDVHTGLGYCEGPAVDSNGHVYFTEFSGDHIIWEVAPDGNKSQYRNPANGANGMEITPSGKLAAAEWGRIGIQNDEGSWVSLTPSSESSAINEANDLSFGPSGSFYFTNFSGGSIFFQDSAGNLTQFTGFSQPNGIEWVPEKGLLYLSANGENKLAVFDAHPDGSFDNRRDLANVNVPDGLTLDQNGNIYVAAYGDAAVDVFDSTGVRLGGITVGAANVSNCVFGGPGNTTLYITGDGGLRKVELKIPGREKVPRAVPVFRGFQKFRGESFSLSTNVLDRSHTSLHIDILKVLMNPAVVSAVNASGSRVKSWRLLPGDGRINWDGINAEAGLYYIKLSTGAESYTAPVILK